MQGAQKLRSEAYFHVRCNDEVEAQRSRWTFYETIKDVSTTMIYTQVLNRGGQGVRSPADSL
jgi:hypothetical protein